MISSDYEQLQLHRQPDKVVPGFSAATLTHQRLPTVVTAMSKPDNNDKAEQQAIDIIVVAASAGGLKALTQILSQLPADLPVPVAIVQHRSTMQPGMLATILSKSTTLKVKNAVEGEHMEAGTVYVAPPDKHLLINQDHTLTLSNGKKIRYILSSANPLFTSAAQVFKDRVIAVVLTGGGDDASDGVQSVKAAGGIVIAQDRESSENFSMPKSAINTGCVDYILALNDIGSVLVHFVKPRS